MLANEGRLFWPLRHPEADAPSVASRHIGKAFVVDYRLNEGHEIRIFAPEFLFDPSTPRANTAWTLFRGGVHLAQARMKFGRCEIAVFRFVIEIVGYLDIVIRLHNCASLSIQF
ncbi:MAG: hypothetical protein U1E25_14680 [Methylocystis sp.]